MPCSIWAERLGSWALRRLPNPNLKLKYLYFDSHHTWARLNLYIQNIVWLVGFNRLSVLFRSVPHRMLFLSPKCYLVYRLRPTAWLRFDLHHLGCCLVCRVEPTTSWHSRLSVVESNIEGHMVFEIDIREVSKEFKPYSHPIGQSLLRYLIDNTF